MLDQIDGLLCLDPDAGRVRRNQELAHLVTASRHHEQHRTLGARLDAVFDAVDAIAGVGAGRRHRRVDAVPSPRPGSETAHDATVSPDISDSTIVGVRLRVGAADQSRQDDADGIQRSGRHCLAELFGDHGQIRKAAFRDAAAAQFFGNEQTRSTRVQRPCATTPGQRTHPRRAAPGHSAGAPLFAGRLGGGGEEYLFGRVDSGHGAGGF